MIVIDNDATGMIFVGLILLGFYVFLGALAYMNYKHGKDIK